MVEEGIVKLCFLDSRVYLFRVNSCFFFDYFNEIIDNIFLVGMDEELFSEVWMKDIF